MHKNPPNTITTDQTTATLSQPHWHKGRGALSNPQSRFDKKRSSAIADGWSEQPEPPQVVTLIAKDAGRSIISKNRSPDIPFTQSINPYRGCEHGCIYCYARPTHAYWDMSPGLDFESKIIIKPNAAELLRRELDTKSYRPQIIFIGANTDPYQPLEQTQSITRALLEVMREYRHPVSLLTKSALILRDLDIIAELASDNLCSVGVSVTTLDNHLKRILEPRTASGPARIDTIRQLTEAGVPVTLMAAPIIPAINDAEMEDILSAGRDAGATNANYILLRLPHEVKTLFSEWLQQHYPQRAEHVMNLVRQSRGGKEYDSAYGKRMTGSGPYAAMIGQRFKLAYKKLGFRANADLGTSQFRARLSHAQQLNSQRQNAQMTLF